ncbi:unc-112 [Bugula neritina]|uniref:Unc-112 n=1 Tax=Bugula neritina TaxID=10212 RepID=A0A7J7JB16_BUGNE|nr:unc-112 [Bugula neritina]
MPEYDSLPMHYTVATPKNSYFYSQQEIVSIGYNLLIRLNPKRSEVTKTYRFSTMSSWSVHWENREIIVDFEEDKLVIKPFSANCKVFHEFLGKNCSL